MGFLGKIKSIADVTSKISSIAGKLDIQNIAEVDLTNLSVDSLSPLKDKIANNLLSKVGGISTDLEGMISATDIESQVTSMTSDLQNSININDLTSSIDGMDFNNLDVNSLLDFDPVNFM